MVSQLDALIGAKSVIDNFFDTAYKSNSDIPKILNIGFTYGSLTVIAAMLEITVEELVTLIGRKDAFDVIDMERSVFLNSAYGKDADDAQS